MSKLFPLLGGGSRTSPSNIRKAYYLYDTFTTDRAAGAVNGTLAEPVGGARVVTDTESKLSISGGLALFTPRASPTAGDPGMWRTQQTRQLGKTFLATVTPATTTLEFTVGWGSAQSGRQTINSLRFLSGLLYKYTFGGPILVATYTATTYQVANIMRTAGSWSFIKGGAFANWTMLYPYLNGGDTGGLYPGASTVSATFSADNMIISEQTYIPVPLQSDGMSAATTDGLGNPENNGPAGNVYDGEGTPAVAAGARGFSALSGGGLGVSVLACSSSDVNIEVNVTRTAGSAGIIARRVDANNYIQCLHNGTNVVVSQVVAGSATTLSTTAVAYSAGATLKFHVEGTAYRAFYNNTAAGSGTVPASTNTNHGIITNNLSGSFDNLVVWARSGYEGLNLL